MVSLRKKQGGWFKRFIQTWKNHRRFQRFYTYVDSLPHGEQPEERVIPYQSAVDEHEYPLYVSSIDYRCMLIDMHTQDHKIKEFFTIFESGNYQQFVDIGANYGEFVIGGVQCAPHILAIEANPIVARCLKRSVQDYSHIEVVDQAVSSTNATLQMRINPQYSGGNRLVEEGNETPDFFIDQYAFILDVPCRKLSELLNHSLTDSTSVAIKMDVEGHEAVLLGEILEWFNPQITAKLLIIFEFNNNSHHAFDHLLTQVERLLALGCHLSTICSRKEQFVSRQPIAQSEWKTAFEDSCEVILEYRALEG